MTSCNGRYHIIGMEGITDDEGQLGMMWEGSLDGKEH